MSRPKLGIQVEPSQAEKALYLPCSHLDSFTLEAQRLFDTEGLRLVDVEAISQPPRAALPGQGNSHV